MMALISVEYLLTDCITFSSAFTAKIEVSIKIKANKSESDFFALFVILFPPLRLPHNTYYVVVFR